MWLRRGALIRLPSSAFPHPSGVGRGGTCSHGRSLLISRSHKLRPVKVWPLLVFSLSALSERYLRVSLDLISVPLYHTLTPQCLDQGKKCVIGNFQTPRLGLKCTPAHPPRETLTLPQEAEVLNVALFGLSGGCVSPSTCCRVELEPAGPGRTGRTRVRLRTALLCWEEQRFCWAVSGSSHHPRPASAHTRCHILIQKRERRKTNQLGGNTMNVPAELQLQTQRIT